MSWVSQQIKLNQVIWDIALKKARDKRDKEFAKMCGKDECKSWATTLSISPRKRGISE